MTLRVWGSRSGTGLAAAALALVVDQGFKLWMLFGFGIAGRQPIALTPFLDLIMAWNTGVSYSLLSMPGMAGQLALAAFQLAIASLLWLWLARTTYRLQATALGLVIGGAFGNALDRLLHGAVADFFLLHLRAMGWNVSWYVFNLADVAIVAGVGALLYDSLVRRPAESAEAAASRKE